MGFRLAKFDGVTIPAPEPSAYLKDLQASLAEAIEGCSTSPDLWIYVPVYGIQYVCDAVPLFKELMIAEAISIGMIGSSADAYFVDAVMYYTDGTTIVPYWWPCEYCSERLRSPELLQQHVEVKHWEITQVKATIVSIGGEQVCQPWPYEEFCVFVNLQVTWQNQSPFPIEGRVRLWQESWGGGTLELTAISGRDALVDPGGTHTAYFTPWEPESWRRLSATLTLIGDPLPGMLLDRVDQ